MDKCEHDSASCRPSIQLTPGVNCIHGRQRDWAHSNCSEAASCCWANHSPAWSFLAALMATLNRRFNKYFVFVAIGAAERDQGCGGKNMIDPRGQSYLAATSVVEAIRRIACQ